jgi:hypothetical protein
MLEARNDSINASTRNNFKYGGGQRERSKVLKNGRRGLGRSQYELSYV